MWLRKENAVLNSNLRIIQFYFAFSVMLVMLETGFEQSAEFWTKKYKNLLQTIFKTIKSMKNDDKIWKH